MTQQPRPSGETAGSDQRESRTLTGPVLAFHLADEIASLKQEPSWQQGDRNGRTLVHEPLLRIVLSIMKSKAQLSEHRAEGPVSIQALEGHLRLTVAETVVDLRPGQVAVVEAAVTHELEAIDESVFLLTIAQPSRL